MMSVSIYPPKIKKTILIRCTLPEGNKIAKAVLLGASGEKLQTFILTNEENELSLDGFEAGTYTMRIEAKNEVIVKQIIIP
jgi:DNA polymerase III delta prime subunit